MYNSNTVQQQRSTTAAHYTTYYYTAAAVFAVCTYRSTGTPRRFRSCLDERGSARRALVSSCLHPCPRTHGEIRSRNGSGRRARDPTLVGSNIKSTHNANNITHQQQQQSSSRYIGCIPVYIHRSPSVARPSSLARRRSCWLYAAVPGTN